MSSRNSYAAKQSARERLRVEREKQAKKAKTKRQLLVGAAVVAVLAIAAGISVFVMRSNQPTVWQAAANKPLIKPAHTSGTNGTTIIYGNPSNKNTLAVYEDMRCPICAQFEQTSGSTVLKLADSGKYKITYTMGTFLDGNLGGTGSKNALSALGAALNVSTNAFIQYHTLLYSKAVHPVETTDSFASNAFLINEAQKIPALKNNKKFQDAVNNGTYDKWALTMSNQFNADGITGTPTVKLNGTAINNVQAMTAAQFTAAVNTQLGTK
jgi:protein-disulfide isomerase